MAEIGCAGILVEDTFCGPMRELPQEGLLTAIDSIPTKAGGCAANVAIDLARQGFTVDVVGCLGHDGSGKALLACLENHQIGCERVIITDAYPTSRTVILLVDGQDRRYIHVFGANRAFMVGHVQRDWLASLKVFYLGGLFAMPAIQTDELLDLLKFCRSRNIVTVVDVVMPQQTGGIADIRPLLPHIDYFLPNDDESRQMTSLADPLDQLRTFQAAGAHTVIVTRGKAGATAAQGGKYWQCGTYPAQVLDPSGSGDAFSGGVITGILRGWDMPQTLRYAAALGASATRAIGTTDGVFTAAEAEAFVASHLLPVSAGSL